jgi:hypothetical protein
VPHKASSPLGRALIQALEELHDSPSDQGAQKVVDQIIDHEERRNLLDGEVELQNAPFQKKYH